MEDAQELRSEIERLGPWHHDIELAPGIGTRDAGPPDGGENAAMPGVYSPEWMIRPLIERVFPGGMEGRSFLDCGCNAGGHVLAAAKAGAGRCFGFDARQHWIDQAEFLRRHFALENAAFARCLLAELPSLRLEPFDVTLFGGLFYHLPDPVAGLRIAADHTRELLVLTTSVLPRKGKALILKQESKTHIMSGVDGVSWLPTGPQVVQEILAWCGFAHSRVDADVAGVTRAGWRRIQVVAARDEATFAHYDRVRPDSVPGARANLARRLRRRLGF